MRRVLGVGLRTGLAQPLLPGKIDVGTAVDATPEQLADVLLSEHLRELFGRGPVTVAVSGGSGAYRKPVLQVFSTDGKPLGFVKVGWNDWTRDAVRREAAALRACAKRPTDAVWRASAAGAYTLAWTRFPGDGTHAAGRPAASS